MGEAKEILSGDSKYQIAVKCVICENNIVVPQHCRVQFPICPKCIKKLRKVLSEVPDDN